MSLGFPSGHQVAQRLEKKKNEIKSNKREEKRREREGGTAAGKRVPLRSQIKRRILRGPKKRCPAHWGENESLLFTETRKKKQRDLTRDRIAAAVTSIYCCFFSFSSLFFFLSLSRIFLTEIRGWDWDQDQQQCRTAVGRQRTQMSENMGENWHRGPGFFFFLFYLVFFYLSLSLSLSLMSK